MKRIILAGGKGFLGCALTEHFSRAGYEVAVLSRTPQRATNAVREILWDGCSLGDWANEVEGANVVINLTGRSVNCRYNERNRRLILDSRVNSTRVLGQAIAQCKKPPAVWLNASTATIYQHTFGPAWTETGRIASTPEAKDAFSVHVATSWERAFEEAKTPLARKVTLRAAMVLGTGKNSVLPALRTLVQLGLGGRMGNGLQFVSWIHESDFCRAIEWVIERPTFHGPVNICAPNPLPNTDMMKILRKIYGMPIGLPATEWMLEIGAFILRTETELMIKSRKVVPAKLIESGFNFEFPIFKEAVENLKGKAN